MYVGVLIFVIQSAGSQSEPESKDRLNYER
jgi:hypothetical protein